MPAASGKTRRKLHPSLAIDMTPMVDLGFLLISFFMFTTTLSEKKGMDLIMPKEGTSMALAACWLTKEDGKMPCSATA